MKGIVNETWRLSSKAIPGKTVKSCLSNKQRKLLQPSSFAEQNQIEKQRIKKKKITSQRIRKNRLMMDNTDKNKPMWLIKEVKEIIELAVLNKSEISKDIF